MKNGTLSVQTCIVCVCLINNNFFIKNRIKKSLRLFNLFFIRKQRYVTTLVGTNSKTHSILLMHCHSVYLQLSNLPI